MLSSLLVRASAKLFLVASAGGIIYMIARLIYFGLRAAYYLLQSIGL